MLVVAFFVCVFHSSLYCFPCKWKYIKLFHFPVACWKYSRRSCVRTIHTIADLYKCWQVYIYIFLSSVFVCQRYKADIQFFFVSSSSSPSAEKMLTISKKCFIYILVVGTVRYGKFRLLSVCSCTTHKHTHKHIHIVDCIKCLCVVWVCVIIFLHAECSLTPAIKRRRNLITLPWNTIERIKLSEIVMDFFCEQSTIPFKQIQKIAAWKLTFAH